MKLVIPGGSGQVGTMLACARHAAGHDVIVLSRRPGGRPWRVMAREGVTLGDWTRELDGGPAVLDVARDNMMVERVIIMVRTQIQLTEVQATRLKARAAQEGRSMADLIRASVDALLARTETRSPEAKRARAARAAGRFHSGLHDLSTHHDRHLADVLGR